MWAEVEACGSMWDWLEAAWWICLLILGSLLCDDVVIFVSAKRVFGGSGCGGASL